MSSARRTTAILTLASLVLLTACTGRRTRHTDFPLPTSPSISVTTSPSPSVPEPPRFYTVDFLTSRDGFVSEERHCVDVYGGGTTGCQGVILHTTDGGKSWTSFLNTPVLTSLSFVDDDGWGLERACVGCPSSPNRW